VFTALFAADVKQAESREAVEKVLREALKQDEATVQFLMKGLQRAEPSESGFHWKFNLESLSKNYSQIAAGVSSSKPFAGEALFIKGEKSSYINPENYTTIEKLFPNHQLTEIKGAGHWVHAEKPAEFVEEVERFLA
jgi:esterase